ncbi:MAG: UvrD-helicase domain-containing protein [Chloroflexota bacterium]|nr:UvrD-helicase domain-containing protein [Chloroflexota bacterium]
MMTDLITGLNPAQREAVTTVDGPVLVLAGPGSGKTRVLTHRIAYLCRECRIYPDHIIAVTFTNKAAAEMRERSERLLGGKLDGLQIGTFHSLCARILRRESDHTPYGREYAIYDTDDQQSVMKGILADLNADTKKFSPGRVLGAISSAKNELIDADTYADLPTRDYFSELVRRAYPIYQKTLVNNNAMDFDDLLMQTVILLRTQDMVREKYQRRLEYVLVDEFQDTNLAQYELVRLFAAPQNNVFVVGDEDQGIYAFRGADYRNVMQFKQDYPQAKVLLLEQNYRSTQIVLDAARAVIDQNSNRTPKALFTERQGGARISVHEAYSEAEEAQYITDKIRDHIRREGRQYKDIAIMYRTNAQSRALEDAMVAAHIPYRLVGGVGFYKRQEVKDILAYLRLIHNPNDTVSFERIVNVPGRGIGKTSVEKFREWAGLRSMGYGEALGAIMKGEPSPITGKASKSLVEFGTLLAQWRELAGQGDLTVLYDEITTTIGYYIYLTGISDSDDQFAERKQNLDELRNVIAQKKDLALGDFLEEVSLVAEVDQLGDEQNSVTMLTLHSAKGLEYPIVFLAGLEDGLLPHSRSFTDPEGMAEERRLLYVGITRAKDRLYMSYAFRRMVFGESSLNEPSRFLKDVPAELTEGLSVKMTAMQDRAGYQRLTTWDSDDSWGRGNRGASQPSGKIVPFPGSRAFQKPAPLPPAAPASPYKIGQRVRHAKFGEGIVQEVERVGQDVEVLVRFEDAGTKRLSTAFAKLQIL